MGKNMQLCPLIDQVCPQYFFKVMASPSSGSVLLELRALPSGFGNHQEMPSRKMNFIGLSVNRLWMMQGFARAS